MKILDTQEGYANKDTVPGIATSFEQEARAFSDYILRDAPPLSSLEDVRGPLKITFCAYESAKKNIAVSFSAGQGRIL